ncbi:hypothetical protein OIU79_003419 [Salix purpurea]|uniref:Uncharacterized protein n=1 Tax=Salix purpurea TaxID=77065 RepID=A0A9Q0ZF62_SALPP|nr:hypothetical protein OIU79_003419 [Salix purpurea]
MEEANQINVEVSRATAAAEEAPGKGLVAKAIIEQNSASDSVSNHKELVSQIKSEAVQARAEMLEARGMVQEKRPSNAVRTDPVHLDADGRAFWKLNGHSVILLQDMGAWNSVEPSEKWLEYADEQKMDIEKYISFSRRTPSGSHREKPKLEQVVIEVNLDSSTDGYLASKQAAENAGVVQGGPDRNHLGVIGDGVDAVHPVNCWRNMFGYAKLGSQQEPMKDVMEDVAVQNKEDENEPMFQPPVPPSIPPRVHPSRESAVDTVERS